MADNQLEHDQQRISRDSDHLLEALEDVRSLEREKRQHDISTPAFHDLASKVTDRARDVFRAAYREEADGDRIDTTDESIEEVEAADRSGGGERVGEDGHEARSPGPG